jgi:AmiR/NasT family two-component response regulator
MERHHVDEQHAFALLREQSRHSGHKLLVVAQAITNGELAWLDAPAA